MKYKIEKTFMPPIHLACGNDDLRLSLNHIQIKDGHAVATNAHALARCPLDYFIESDELISKLDGKYILAKHWKAIFKNINKEDVFNADVEDDFLRVRSKDSSDIMIKLVTEDEMSGIGKYPQWEKLWNELIETEKTPISYIGINPRLIDTVYKIMLNPHAGIVMSFLSEMKAISIMNVSNDIECFLMPISITENEKRTLTKVSLT